MHEMIEVMQVPSRRLGLFGSERIRWGVGLALNTRDESKYCQNKEQNKHHFGSLIKLLGVGGIDCIL